MDMSGGSAREYVLTNVFDEPIFVLFKCPHPQAQSGGGQNLLAGGLRLQASAIGVQENTKDAWLWSGTLEPRNSATIEISYQVASVKGVALPCRRTERNSGQATASHFRRQDSRLDAFRER